VDDNNRVRKGGPLVELDKEPFQIAVAVKKAGVDTATADLEVAKARVHGIEAEARSPRWTLQRAMEGVEDAGWGLTAAVSRISDQESTQ
jgi:membrane fusion protein, multidrug efflux system